MKKIVITIGLAALMTTAYGQGWVSVVGQGAPMLSSTNASVNLAGTATGNPATGVFISNATTGTNWIEVLLTSPTSAGVEGAPGTANSLWMNASAVNSWMDTGLLGKGGIANGRLSIGNGLQANNAVAGNTQTWMIVAWSAQLGADWATVSAILISGNNSLANQYLGWSAIGTGAAGPAAPGLPLTIQGPSGSIITTGFNLYAVPVPEPSTLALAGLGGLSLLLFRRRK